jgi:hypothetical protein
VARPSKLAPDFKPHMIDLYRASEGRTIADLAGELASTLRRSASGSQCSSRSMLTVAGPGVGLRWRDRVAKDIEVYADYGHEGGVDYQVDWQLSWFVECFPDQG